MIEQQLYSRSSHGLFLASQGYDTVRKSNGLSDDDAKDNHKYYTYEGSNIPGLFDEIQIIKRQIKPNGDVLLIGSNPYQYLDNSGIRVTFICHAFIMKADSPELKKQSYDIRQIAGVTEFIDYHNDGTNEPLDQLDQLPFPSKYSEIDYVKSTIQRLPKKFLAKIICASILSVYTDKKVYIVPEGIDETFTVMNLIRTIYYCIPFSLRNKIGYTSLLNDILPSGINIAFVPECYIDSVKNGNVFNNYINKDFCFGILDNEVFYDGEGILSKETELLQMIEDLLDENIDLELISKKLKFIESTLNGAKLTKERLITIAKFLNNLSDDEESIVNCISTYFCFDSQMNIKYASDLLFSSVCNFAEATQGKLTPTSVSYISKLYNDADESNKQLIFNTIRESIVLCTDSDDEYFSRLEASNVCPILRSKLLDSLLKDNLAAKIYYRNIFSDVSNIKELIKRVSSYTNSEIENVSFISIFNTKVLELYSADSSITFIKELLDELKFIRNQKFITSAEETVRKIITEYTEKKSAYWITIDEVKFVVQEGFRQLCDNKEFLKVAKQINAIFNPSFSVSPTQYQDLLRDAGQYDGGKLKDYTVEFFENNEVDIDRFLAITLAYYDSITDSIDFRGLYANFKSLNIVKQYTIWLTRKFNYLSIYNDMKADDGSIEIGHKLPGVANAVLRATATIREEIGLKEANDYCEDMVAFIVPEDELYDDVAKEMEKGLKRALKGKDFPIITAIEINEEICENLDDNAKDKKAKRSLFSKKK